MKIIQDLLSLSKFTRPGVPLGDVTHVVLHYVQNPGSTAKQNRDFFESLRYGKVKKPDGSTWSSSAHAIVGLRGEIIMCVPFSEMAWHAGDIEYNHHSIGIEFCHPKADGKPTEETLASLVELFAFIVRTYVLAADCLIRHYDITHKLCPRWFVEHPEDMESFRSAVYDRNKSAV